MKTELAGGVVYKGGATPSVSGTNITLTGAATPIKTGYMYSITSGSITVNDVVYTTGDYIIYKGTESASTTVPQSDVVFINAQDTDVAKLGADNEFTGSNTFTISGNQTFEVTSNDESTTIILNAGTGEFRIDPNEVSMGTDNGIVKCNSNGILLDTTNTPNSKAYYNNKEIATVDQIPDMTNVAYTNKANVFTQQNTFNDSVKIGSITISENTISNESDEYGYESLKLVCSENIDSTSSNLNLVASNNAHINGSGEFKVLVSSNPQNFSNFRMDNNIIRLNNNTNGITITKDIVEFDTVPTIGSGESAKLVATTDQLPTLPEGTKQLPTDGTWTMSDVVNLLNKVAAALGAPVYSA